jgi:hypothetical protein
MASTGGYLISARLYRNVSSSEAEVPEVDEPVVFEGMPIPFVGNEPAEDVGDILRKIPSSPVASFHAFRPPINSMGGLFRGRWNSFSKMARKRAEMGEFAEPGVDDFSSYIMIRSNLDRFLNKTCSVEGDITCAPSIIEELMLWSSIRG